MSIYLGEFQGKKIIKPLFTAQPVETVDRDDIILPTDYQVEQPPSFWHETVFLADCVLDVGGHFDCFLRAFNYLYFCTVGEKPVSTESIYKALGLDLGEYLEDVHIDKIARYYNATVLVTSRVAEKLYCTKLGSGDKLFMIHNEFPMHFYAYCFEPKTEEKPPTPEEVKSEKSESEELEEFMLDVEEETEEPLSWGDYDEDEAEIEQDYRISALPEAPDAQTLYNYLRDFPRMVYESLTDVLSCYRIVHNTLLNKISDYSSKGVCLPEHYIKLYYKARHNVFAAICLDSLGVRVLETDCSLSGYIDSKKTPDYILDTGKTVYLIEFTVSNRYESADFSKGGGNQNVKYTDESLLMSQKLNKSVLVKIVPAILDEYNVEEVKSILADISPVNVSLLKDFFSIANKNRNNISSAYFAGTCRGEGVTQVKGVYEIPQLSRTEMFDPHFVTVVLKNWSWLKDHVVGQIQRWGSEKKVGFVYDKDKGRINMTYSTKGLKKITLDRCQTLLETSDLSSVLNLINYKEGGKIVFTTNLKGNIPLTVLQQPKKATKTNWKYRSQLSVVYEKPFPKDSSHEEYPDFSEDQIQPQKKPKVLFPPDYFNKLSTFGFKELLSSESRSLLANNIMSADYLGTCVTVFKEEYKKTNNDSRMMFCPKQSFILPMVTVPGESAELDEMPIELINRYLASSNYTYTKAILAKARDKLFFNEAVVNDQISLARDELSAAKSQYFKKLRDAGLVKKYQLFTPAEKILVSLEKNKYGKALSEYSTLLKNAKRRKVRVVKLNCGRRSMMKKEFEKEMEHFQKKSKGLKGVGEIRNASEVDNFFKQLTADIIQPKVCSLKKMALYNKTRGPGPSLLSEDKDFYTRRWDEFYETSYGGSVLEQLSTVASNLSRLLFNESMKSYNKDYIKVDNLGTNSTLVLVRGGAKSYRNNMSKLFKVIFYCRSDHVKYFGYQENPDFECFPTTNGVLVSTPWSQIHLDILYDWFSMNSRVFMNCYTNHTRSGLKPCDRLEPLSVFPSLLGFHNRRKTEQLLHNIRYLVVNPMGLCANLQDIIKGFAGFNYSYFDAWLKNCLSERYLHFARQFNSISLKHGSNLDNILSEETINDLWYESPFRNADQLTSFIYMTYMMTKAPVNASLEQASNLKEVLKDVQLFEDLHSDVDHMKDESLHSDIFDFKEEDYLDDFKYDPVFCQYLGFHLSGFLRTRLDSNEINALWKGSSNRGLSYIANSNGLRGFRDENFYGKKGYEVVYDKITELLEVGDVKLDKLVEQYVSLDPEGASQMIQADTISRKELTLDKITFHIVHKIQRGGSREIFCMDLITKAYQNPLEDFFKKLCRNIPNEFISIPSNKRHSIIHTDFFERTPAPWVKNTLRWVLDCRRWAPHSVFQKYMHFIHGMSNILPDEMVQEFSQFGELMMEKRFITRSHVIDTIKNNVAYKDLKGVIKENSKDIHEFEVKFSFVMGIFNYLSTLMHAANQMVASEVILKYNLGAKKGLVLMDAKCHSDDSVVSSYHEKEESEIPSIKIYDWLLKCGNHMLSVKKSQVNKDVYLEFLSILYMFDRFVPVIPKFLSAIPFKPTDQGYASDVSFALTQCTEVMIQGGTVEEAFLITKLTECYVQNIYGLNPNYEVPYQMLGGIDIHPLECLVGGAYSEVYKHMKYNTDKFWAAYHILEKAKLIESDDPLSFQVKWDLGHRVGSRVRNKFTKFEFVTRDINQKYPWTLNNCKLGNEYLNLIWFTNKLSDPKYYSSLMHEPESRRFSRAFGSAKYRNLMTSEGKLILVSDVTNLLYSMDMFCSEVDTTPNKTFSDVLGFVCDDLEGLYQGVYGGEWDPNSRPNGFKDKPVYFNFSLPQVSGLKIDGNSFVSYVREPEGYKLLGRRSNPYRDVNKIQEYCKALGLDISILTNQQLFSVVNKVINSGEHNFRLIAPVPSEHKRIDSYNGVVSYLCHNSVKGVIRPIICLNTSRVDWKRKVMKGRVPDTVADSIESTSVVAIARKYGVIDEDIFVCDLVEKEKEDFRLVPSSWKPLLMAATSDHTNKVLIDETFWLLWVKEQIKSEYGWYGSGELIVNIPEAMIKIKTYNGRIESVSYSSADPVMFDTTSNWFLHNLFSMQGMQLPLEASEYHEDGNIYFGYHSSSGKYGISYANRFDLVLPTPINQESVDLSFMYLTSSSEKRGRYWIYKDSDRDWKVEFYIPTVDLPQIDISKYVDLDKIRPRMLEDHIRKFTFNVSIDIRSEYVFKLEDAIDTISFSKLYKVIHNHPDFVKVVRGQKADGILFESLVKWKELNPDFAFPNVDEMVDMAKREDLPQLPMAAQKLLFKIGESTISDEDYENLLLNLYSLPSDQRVSYLLSMFPVLTDEEKVHTLVIASRSDRVYSSCSLLGRSVFRLLNPLTEVLVNIVEDRLCSSETLSTLTSRFRRGMNEHFNEAYFLRLMLAKIVIDGMCVRKVTSEGSSIVALFTQILDELIDGNLGRMLNLRTANVPLLQSIEFEVEREKLVGLYVDVIDSLYLGAWFNKPPTRRQLMKSAYDTEISIHKKSMLKLLEWKNPKYLETVMKRKGKKRTVKRIEVESGVPGIIDVPFVPLGEDDMDEFEAGYDWNPDIMEDLMLEEFGTAKQIAFCRITCANRPGIMSIRGSAHTLLVEAQVSTREILGVHGHVEIYRKKNFSSCLDYMNTLGSYIYCISEGKKNLEIIGYEKVSITEYYRSENKMARKEVILEGKSYLKTEVATNSMLSSKIMTADQYFKRATLNQAEIMYKETEKKSEILAELPQIREDYDIFRERLKAKIDNYHARQRELKGLPEESVETKKSEIAVNLGEDLRKAMSELEGNWGTDAHIPQSKRRINTGTFNFKNSLKLLNDPEIIGTFNALFPNMWGLYEEGKLRLTSITKNAKLEYMQLKLAAMPQALRDKYAKIYSICSILINDIDTCQSVIHETHELSQALDSLFSIPLTPPDTLDLMRHLEPGVGEFRTEPDLDRIFRKRK